MFMKLIQQRRKEKENEKSRRSAWRRQEYEKQAEGCHNEQDIKVIMSLQKQKCYFCWELITTSLGELSSRKKYEKDHLKPVCKNGNHWPHNIALTCRTCNQLKSSLNEEAFWKLLEEEHGKRWVKPKKALADSNRREKHELTKTRRVETAKRHARRQELRKARTAKKHAIACQSKKTLKKLGLRRACRIA